MDKFDEIARKTCTTGMFVTDTAAVAGYRRIAAAIRAAVDERHAACARAVCPLCESGTDMAVAKPSGRHFHVTGRGVTLECKAAAIHAMEDQVHD